MAEKRRINSRTKGVVGERELAAWLTERGWPARRGQQYRGTDDSPDVVCPRMAEKGLHIEVKRVERINIQEALKKAEVDAGDYASAVVFHRRNGEEWLATVRAEVFMDLLENGLDPLAG